MLADLEQLGCPAFVQRLCQMVPLAPLGAGDLCLSLQYGTTSGSGILVSPGRFSSVVPLIPAMLCARTEMTHQPWAGDAVLIIEWALPEGALTSSVAVFSRPPLRSTLEGRRLLRATGDVAKPKPKKQGAVDQDQYMKPHWLPGGTIKMVSVDVRAPTFRGAEGSEPPPLSTIQWSTPRVVLDESIGNIPKVTAERVRVRVGWRSW